MCLILLPYNLVNNMEAGLDPSWKIAIGLALQKNLCFGTDFIFTYGPLGFLKSKYLLGTNKWTILFFEVFIITSFVYGIKIYASKFSHWLSQLILVLLCLSIKEEDTIHLLFPCLIIHAFYFLKENSILSLWICAVVSILSLYIKVNYGIISILLFYGILLASIIKDQKNIRILWPPLATNVILLILISLVYNVDLQGHILTGFFLTKSYNEAMAIPLANNADPSFLIALLCTFVILIDGALTLKNGYKNRSAWANIFLAFLYFFLLFKNGFVRSDEVHSKEFLCLVPIPFLLISLTGEKYYDFRNIGFVVITLITFLFTSGFSNSLLSLNYFKQIFNYVNQNEISYGNKDTKYATPLEIVASIGNQTVDIFPWEVAALYKNKLVYDPRPIIQSYSAYDEYLDSLNAEKIKSGKGPQNILYANDPIDIRVPFWEESITKRQILANYVSVSNFELLENAVNSVSQTSKFNENEFSVLNPEVCQEFKMENLSIEDYFYKGIKTGWYNKNLPEKYKYIYLKKSQHPLNLVSNKLISERTIKVGEELDIPKSRDPLYMYAEIDLNWIGKLKSFFLHPDPLLISFLYEDSTIRSYQAIIPIFKTGVLVNMRVIDKHDAYLFFKYASKRNKKIESIRFLGSSLFTDIKIKLVQTSFQ